MTDSHDQAPKKPARPNLFGPAPATRVIDERISVLASLDANPPPKKKKRRGLAKSTIVLLAFAGTLLAGVGYLTLTQSEHGEAQGDTGTQPVASYHEPVTATVNASSEAPSISLSALAASPATPQQSEPATATIENVATRDPIAILESGNSPQLPDSALAPQKTATPASLLKALNAPEPGKQSASKTSVSAEKKAKTDDASKRNNRAAPTAGRATSSQAAPVDSDVVLLEGLLASSNRQEARDRAKKAKETGKDSGRAGEAGKSAEKTEP